MYIYVCMYVQTWHIWLSSWYYVFGEICPTKIDVEDYSDKKEEEEEEDCIAEENSNQNQIVREDTHSLIVAYERLGVKKKNASLALKWITYVGMCYWIS
jgi:hypothetical protein